MKNVLIYAIFFYLFVNTACLGNPSYKIEGQSEDRITLEDAQDEPENNIDEAQNASTIFNIQAGEETETQIPAACDGFRENQEIIACVDTFPTTISGDTNRGQSVFDKYACADDIDESGPEQIIRVELNTPSYLFVSLKDPTDDEVDVDLHILSDLSNDGCLDRGHLDAGDFLPAGTYYIVVDSWVDAEQYIHAGAYTLDVHQLSLDAMRQAGLSDTLSEDTLTAFARARKTHDVSGTTFAVVDFSRPASDTRFFLFDIASRGLLFREQTSHGLESATSADAAIANYFDNQPASDASSLGVAMVGDSLSSEHVELVGLEPSLNSALQERGTTLRQFSALEADFIERSGFTQPTQAGDIGLAPDVYEAVIDEMPFGSFVLFSHHEIDWKNHSIYFE